MHKNKKNKKQLYYFKDASCGIVNHAVIATLIALHHNTTTECCPKGTNRANALRVFGRWLNKWKTDGKISNMRDLLNKAKDKGEQTSVSDTSLECATWFKEMLIS